MSIVKVRYVGLDVHKRVVEACIVDQVGKVIHRERFALGRGVLKTFATKILRPSDHVALEATTNCWAMADALRPHVTRVVVSNPMATKAIAQSKVKTDKVDAHVLAQLLRCDFLPEVWQPDEATRRLRELTGRRSALVSQRTMMRNRIHSVLAMRLVEAPSRLFKGEGLAWLATVELDDQARPLVDSDLRQLEFLQKEIDAFDTELARRGHDNEHVKLLMTLPSVDVTTAEAMSAAWGDFKRFPDGDHAASYLGLVPSTKQSAAHCYHGPITKRGNSQARWMLIEAAQHLDKHPGPLGHFFRRLCRKKNRNVAVVAAARKMAMIGWQMLINNEPYRYAVPRSTETKLARLRVKATGVCRKRGPAKGQKPVAKLPGGSRTVKSLAGVYQSESLPAIRSLTAGERRTLKAAGCDAFVAEIAGTQVLPRRSKARNADDRHGDAPSAPQAAAKEATTVGGSGKPAPQRHKAAGHDLEASCPVQPTTERKANRFRRRPVGKQGDEAPPPAPPTLSSVPGRRRAAAAKSLPAS